MKVLLINSAVGVVIFALGIALTVHKYGKRNRIAFTVVAILAPFVSVFAVFRLLYLFARGRVAVNPCPEGLEEAEKIVEIHRQKMFGGPLRQPSFTASWKMAYEHELQQETDQVQRVAQRYLAVA